jgi:hypothetical protein
LVGAKELPSEDKLSRETLYLSRHYRSYYLSYELRSNNLLTLTRTRDGPTDEAEIVEGKEKIRVSADIARQFRKIVWRLRPEKLEDADKELSWPIRPLGCKRRGPHDFGEISIVFVDDENQKSSEDFRIGFFDLPYESSCNTPAAKEARAVILRGLRLLPPSTVIERFQRTS